MKYNVVVTEGSDEQVEEAIENLCFIDGTTLEVWPGLEVDELVLKLEDEEFKILCPSYVMHVVSFGCRNARSHCQVSIFRVGSAIVVKV